jgi:hypothetical protein
MPRIGVAVLQLAMGCAMEMDEKGAAATEDDSVASTAEAIRNGWSLDPDEVDRGGFAALVLISPNQFGQITAPWRLRRRLLRDRGRQFNR